MKGANWLSGSRFNLRKAYRQSTDLVCLKKEWGPGACERLAADARDAAAFLWLAIRKARDVLPAFAEVEPILPLPIPARGWCLQVRMWCPFCPSEPHDWDVSLPSIKRLACPRVEGGVEPSAIGLRPSPSPVLLPSSTNTASSEEGLLVECGHEAGFAESDRMCGLCWAQGWDRELCPACALCAPCTRFLQGDKAAVLQF